MQDVDRKQCGKISATIWGGHGRTRFDATRQNANVNSYNKKLRMGSSGVPRYPVENLQEASSHGHRQRAPRTSKYLDKLRLKR